MPGETSGRQSAVVRSAGASGSWAKAQPPAARQLGPGAAWVGLAACDLTERARVVLAIAGVTAEEFEGEARAFELIQLFDRVR